MTFWDGTHGDSLSGRRVGPATQVVAPCDRRRTRGLDGLMSARRGGGPGRVIVVRMSARRWVRGWPVDEIARRRALDARGARSADAEAALAPAAPRIDPGGRLDLVVRAVAAAYLMVLLAAVVLT